MKKNAINKSNGFVITAAVIVIAILFVLLSVSTTKPLSSLPTSKKFDKFGISEIYPTKPVGREWFINMDNPASDGIFDPQSNISRQTDGSWRIGGKQTGGKFYDEVRMNVNTPTGAENWKNIEITGYAKINALVTNYNNTPNYDLTWYARGGRHNPDTPCEGTAYMGGIYADGKVGWKKEIWFTGGYTNERDHIKVTDSIIGRWIGWKVIMYNIENDSAVKLESYLDNNATNNWIKVTDLVDNGGWYAKASDSVFNSPHCDKPKDYIITNGGPIATFRSDDMVWDFRDLSVREIQPNE
jgi:hypothetical protein